MVGIPRNIKSSGRIDIADQYRLQVRNRDRRDSGLLPNHPSSGVDSTPLASQVA